ncbi:MAG: ATP-binding protein [Bacilli bacterium]|nr:ATP-binding protein [Bacilli bacterium]
MNHEILKRIIFDQHDVIKNTYIVDRDIELEQDVNYVLVGLRRSGKSTLLYKRVQDLIRDGVEWNQIIYINFDDERLIDFKATDFDDIVLVAEEMSDKKHYFYFDEIQEIDGWEKFAIRLANHHQKVDITGSNAKMLSKEVEAKLGGRYISKEIMPYSFREFLRAKGLENTGHSAKDIASLNAMLEEFFKYGGFPETISFKNKREYVSNVYQKVLYNDIIVHNQIRNENGVKLMIKKIAESIKQDISFTRIQNIITGIGYKISKDIVIDYCGYCKDAFLLFTLENYYASFLDKSSNPKYYFMDNGVLNLFIDDDKSSLLENIVALKLYRESKDSLYYLKGTKVDIDFYVSSTNTAVQVAMSLSPQSVYEREVNNLVEFAKESKEKNPRLLIVTYEEERTIEVHGITIEVVPLKKFLLG